MKTKLNFLLISALLIAVCSSCGVFHKADVVPSTALDSNNYEYVRSVKAKISYTHVLGFGGLKEKSLMQKLLTEANLQPGEALVNVAVQSRNRFYLVFDVKDFIATAQVVKFTDDKACPKK